MLNLASCARRGPVKRPTTSIAEIPIDNLPISLPPLEMNLGIPPWLSERIEKRINKNLICIEGDCQGFF
jgi:hypothetical protein